MYVNHRSLIFKMTFEKLCATHILAFEGESTIAWFEGNYSDYEEDRKKRLGKEALTPKRIKYARLER